MEAIIWILLIVIFVDGIKFLYDFFSSSFEYKYRNDHSLVTVLIPSRNGEDRILESLKATASIFLQKQIIVAVNGSNDKTCEIIKNYFPNINVVNLSCSGKTEAIKTALKYVKTPYVLLLDDDTILSNNFKCPTSLLNSECTAVAFNVVPKVDQEQNTLPILLQYHEYLKAMQIGRKSHNKSKSVLCISGAAGLFSTQRLEKTLELHSGIFQGEDLENTLIELLLDGKTVFVNETVHTVVPRTFVSLAKQRIIGWWPGLYRNLPYLVAIFLKGCSPFRLRWTIAYEMFNCFAAPLKLLSLIILTVNQMWLLLGVLYVFYLLLEILAYLKIRNISLRYTPLTLLFYPLYGLLQISFYNIAIFFFAWKLAKKEWKVKFSFPK